MNYLFKAYWLDRGSNLFIVYFDVYNKNGSGERLYASSARYTLIKGIWTFSTLIPAYAKFFKPTLSEKEFVILQLIKGTENEMNIVARIVLVDLSSLESN